MGSVLRTKYPQGVSDVGANIVFTSRLVRVDVTGQVCADYSRESHQRNKYWGIFILTILQEAIRLILVGRFQGAKRPYHLGGRRCFGSVGFV